MLNLRNIKLGLIIFLVSAVGVIFIYWASEQFLPKPLPRQISFEPEEVEKEPAAKKEAEEPALDFELKNLEGEKVRVSDYKNKIIILSFWTTWNPAGQDQLVLLESYFNEIKDNKFVVLLAVNNMEDKSVVLNFIKRGGYALPVLLDEKGEVGELYKINTLPATFFINPQGIVKETFVGVLSKEELRDKAERLY